MQKTESLDGKPIRPSARTGSTFNVLLKIQNAVHSLSGKLRASLNSLPFWPAVALIFTLMIIYNYDHIFNPPHWDDMIGLHNQALFLAKHHFNFWELWHEKVTIHPYFNIGEGSNIYPYSVVALFWAVLYRWLEPSWAHCTGHIVYMLCLALSGGLFFNTLRRLSVSGVWAAVFTLLAFLEPIMSGRTAAIGQECPLILGTMLAIFFWAKQQTRKAVVTAALSIFLRDTAGIFVIVILLTAFMEWILTHWNNRNSARRKWEICGHRSCPCTHGSLCCLYLDDTKNDQWPDRIKPGWARRSDPVGLHPLYQRIVVLGSCPTRHPYCRRGETTSYAGGAAPVSFLLGTPCGLWRHSFLYDFCSLQFAPLYVIRCFSDFFGSGAILAKGTRWHSRCGHFIFNIIHPTFSRYIHS